MRNFFHYFIQNKHHKTWAVLITTIMGHFYKLLLFCVLEKLKILQKMGVFPFTSMTIPTWQRSWIENEETNSEAKTSTLNQSETPPRTYSIYLHFFQIVFINPQDHNTIIQFQSYKYQNKKKHVARRPYHHFRNEMFLSFFPSFSGK